MIMADAGVVARFLIETGYDRDEPEESQLLCPMRLQKMLYYAQGWSIALLGRPLFPQDIEAWRHGPVVREVYDTYRGCSTGIQPDLTTETVSHLSDTEKKLLRVVWEEYARFTPAELRRKTHEEAPWKTARGSLPTDAISCSVISRESLREFFVAHMLKNYRHHGIDPRDAWRAEEDKNPGEVVSREDAFAYLFGDRSGGRTHV